MKRTLLFAVLLTLTAGCYSKGYKVDRSVKGFHLLGIGWVNAKYSTNQVRAFVVGSLDAASFRATANTNAPRSFGSSPLGTLLTPP